MISNKLFILRQSKTKEIYAISEYEEWIAYYLQLFNNFFDIKNINKSNYQIDIITNKNEIIKYLNQYQYYQLYPRGIKNNLVLTEWEWDYYKPFFKELYERIKDTIINLQVFQNIYIFGKESQLSKEMGDVSNKLYNISCDFDTFMENLPISFIQTEVLEEPIQAHKFNQFIQEIQNNYLSKIYK